MMLNLLCITIDIIASVSNNIYDATAANAGLAGVVNGYAVSALLSGVKLYICTR